MLVVVLLLFLGLGLLSVGAEWVVRGAARLALSLGVSALAVGLTVVAFGTSAPELVVSVWAAARDNTEIAVGNVVGSNIANIGLIAGMMALLAPLPIGLKLLRREVALMVGVTLVFYGLAWRLEFARWAGWMFLLGFVAFLVLVLHWSRRESATIENEFAQFEHGKQSQRRHPARDWLLVGIGLTALLVGAQQTVASAVALAQALGVSEMVIGASVVAIGTSLPELATCMVAAYRKQLDIGIGNLVGSNLFNILAIFGLAAVVRPIPLRSETVHFEFAALLIFTAALAIVARTGHRVSRAEGLVLLASYVVFIVLLLRR